jgi:tryptophan synthase alpha chain
MEKCAVCGIDGVIVPDLPFEERGEISDECKRRGVTLISLVAPTSGDRIAKIARESEGFLYCVSSLGVTGVRDSISTDIGGMAETIRKYTDTPCAVGFGISTPEQARAMAAVSDGVIVGSAIVRIIEEHGADSPEYVKKYIADIRNGIDG